MTDEERAHARIEAALGQIGTDVSAPAGWEARVLAEVHSRPRRRAWWKLAVPALAAGVAAAAAIVIVPRLLRSPEPEGQSAVARAELVLEIEADGAKKHRGASAKVGDTIIVTAAGVGEHRAVWIYRGKQRVIGCPKDPGCSSKDGAEIATLRLERPGSYTLVALSSNDPLPDSASSFDGSMAAATNAGAEWKTEHLEVQ